eukprot:COSAG02_NODE_8380_length_2591_cov_15.477323_3_plen_432_part_00
MSVHAIVSKKLMPSDDVPQQLLTLSIELLRSRELPELAIGGAWRGAKECMDARPGLAPVAMKLGLFDLAVEHLRAIGSPADVVSILRGKAGRGHAVLDAVYEVTRAFAGQKARPDLEAAVSTGLFDFCVEIVVAVASAGVDGLHDTNHSVLSCALNWLARCSNVAGCEATIRSAATALAFCLENPLDYIEEIGATTGASAARVCCSVFGRDEGGSTFTFTPLHIKTLTDSWSQVIRAVGYRVNTKPTGDTIHAAQLCVSDANKPMLIANEMFVPYLVDALLLDPEHPRAGMKEELKAWCQQHHCEALAQLAVHDGSREALLRDGSVVPALEAVMKDGLSEEARELAAAALSALSERELVATEGQKHVMLSCEFRARLSFMLDCCFSCGREAAGRLTGDALTPVAWSRPMGSASHDPAAERVADGSLILDLV